MMYSKKTQMAISRSLTRGRFIFCLCIILLLGMVAPRFPESLKRELPHAPLTRGSGRLYSVTVNVHNKKRTTGWPLLPETNWCEVRLNTISAVNTRSQFLEFIVDENKSDSRQWRFQFPELDYSFRFSPKAYSSILDNQKASKIPWPETWSPANEYYKNPSKFIESNDPVFTHAVEQNGQPHSVPIHIAAKVLIRYCLLHIESNGKYSQTAKGITTGIDVKGARNAVKTGKGSAVDLVCVCVATLRAAGIPARPVLGITNANTIGNLQIEPQYMVWGEYALPDAGWVPFVPERMRGTVEGLSLEEAWQGLGTLPWLNRRIPISYNFNTYDADRSTQNIQMTLLSSTQESQ